MTDNPDPPAHREADPFGASVGTEAWPDRARSSTVEPSAHNGLVAGSSPAAPTTSHSAEDGPADQWQDIATAPAWARIIACGWQPRQGNVAGYWWMHEDNTLGDGTPDEHKTATLFQPLPAPPTPRAMTEGET